MLGPEVGLMSELQRINLSHNTLSGPVPLLACLGRLPELRQVCLSHNKVTTKEKEDAEDDDGEARHADTASVTCSNV